MSRLAVSLVRTLNEKDSTVSVLYKRPSEWTAHICGLSFEMFTLLHFSHFADASSDHYLVSLK